MRAAMPAHLSFDDFIAACQRPLRRSIRVNTLKISVDDFLSLVAPYGWQLAPVPWCAEGFWIEREDDDALPLGSTAEHLSGLFYIQEASSMLPVAALFADNRQPERVMDVAAAPGSKTTQIAARMGNAGGILANEFSASRVKVLHANISRCGISNVALTHFDGRVFGAALPETFDAILLDAPCSGEGVVRKDADALKNWSPESNLDIAATQRELIDSAFHALRPGGTLVYSTCTLNREENQSVIEWLLSRYPQAVEILPLGELFPGAADALTAEGFLHVFPQIYDCEGFFVARLRKTAAIDPLPAPGYKVGKFPFTPLKDREAAAVTAAAGLLARSGTQAIRCGSGIKSCGCFRWLWSPCSARCAFLASACARRNCTIRGTAGSMRRLSPLPRRSAPSSCRRRKRRNGIAGATSIRKPRLGRMKPL